MWAVGRAQLLHSLKKKSKLLYSSVFLYDTVDFFFNFDQYYLINQLVK